jgi:large subunit ribosomal protein L16
MLFPKKAKHRKWQTRREHPEKVGYDTKGATVSFGSFGLKAIDPARITANQIEAARRVIKRAVGKTGKVWIRIFPDRPVTKKPAEVKMGKGKGDVDHYCTPIRPGRVLFEVDGVRDEVAREALVKASKKLPIRAKVVSREIFE